MGVSDNEIAQMALKQAQSKQISNEISGMNLDHLGHATPFTRK